MSFLNLDIKTEYRTKSTNISKDFLIPCLSEAISYKRAVGFFSSTSLPEIAQGLVSIVKNGGHIKLIASPYLSAEDVEAISKGYISREVVLRDATLRSLPDVDELDNINLERLNLLAYLISEGILDIKIAFADSSTGIGMYHEKLGLMEDAEGNCIAFSGSMNESENAMIENYETVDVFKSWQDPEGRVKAKKNAFDAIWNDSEKGVSTFDFPEVKEKIKKKYLRSKPDLNNLLINPQGNKTIIAPPEKDIKPFASKFGQPTLPNVDWLKIRSYQTEAVDVWEANSFRGIFSMATGTGKTITALIALLKLYQKLDGNLFVIITCPLQHLVEQWVEDLNLFNINPIIAYSGSPQKSWKQDLKRAIFDRKIGTNGSEFICLITTNAMLSTEQMQSILGGASGNILFIADEAHNMGAQSYQRLLNEMYSYRIGLSATLDRHRDDEGTSVLRDYFGATCISYPLEKAIKEGMLSKYKYYPIPVTLTSEEYDEYCQLTKEICRCFVRSKGGISKLNEYGRTLALKRSRLIAAASDKLPKLKEVIEDYRNAKHMLIYCGSAQILNEKEDKTSVYEDDNRQITKVVDILGNELGVTVSKFTSEEDIVERGILKQEFKDGNLQALAAIKCLDEGVNIPSIRTAFMLASTTNPKEYIQRRGRLLRLSENKEFAEIFDFITLPISLNEASGKTLDDIRGVYTLVNNELTRGVEFAQYAINFTESLAILDEIRDTFKIDELKMKLELEKQDLEDLA